MRRDVFEAPLITVKSSSQIHVDPFYALQVLAVQVGLEVVLDVVVAVEEEVVVALVEDSGLDDGRVDAKLDRQDLADQEAQIQSPSVVVHAVASAGVDLVEVRRLLVGKDLCIHQTAVAVVGAAAELGVVDVDAAAAADDVDAGLVVARQSNHHAVTCIEHELRQHDGVLQPVLLLRELCPRLLWLCDGPTIQPYSWIAFHCEESCVWGRAELRLRWAAGETSDRLILV
jgi:hypothetical protein